MQPTPLLRSFLQHPLYVVELVGGCFLVRLLYFGSPFNSRCKVNIKMLTLYRFG